LIEGISLRDQSRIDPEVDPAFSLWRPPKTVANRVIGY
jgi:hypothetical protein